MSSAGEGGERWRAGLYGRLRPAARGASVSVRLGAEELATLDALAGVWKVSRSQVIRWLLSASSARCSAKVVLGERPHVLACHTRRETPVTVEDAADALVPA